MLVNVEEEGAMSEEEDLEKGKNNQRWVEWQAWTRKVHSPCLDWTGMVLSRGLSVHQMPGSLQLSSPKSRPSVDTKVGRPSRSNSPM